MKKILILTILVITSNCSFKDVKKTHGIKNLNKKSSKLVLNATNSNDILNILGPPSTKSELDPNTWIYIERKVSNSSVFTIGKEKLASNNLLVLKVNDRGILYEMELYDLTKDPYELNNLADKISLKDTLFFLREVLDQWIIDTNDLGEYSEKELIKKWFYMGKLKKLESLTKIRKNNKVFLKHKDKGATIVWRDNRDSIWKIYKKPLEYSNSIRAKAVRIGYKDSEILSMD